MVQGQRTRCRDAHLERRERLRYRLLEQIYLLTGPEPGGIVNDRDLEEEPGQILGGASEIAEELERVGYLERCRGGSGVCITDAGIEYLRRGAWRRRSIRI